MLLYLHLERFQEPLVLSPSGKPYHQDTSSDCCTDNDMVYVVRCLFVLKLWTIQGESKGRHNRLSSCHADVAIGSSQPDWLAFDLTQPMIDKLSSSTDKMLPNKAAITMPNLTLRLVAGFTCLSGCLPVRLMSGRP